jgi:tetratricopeptide (TPR) repeat protein
MNYAKGLIMLAATLAALRVFAETAPETAQAVTLEYKLKPSQKLEYAVEGNAKQSMGGNNEAKFSGKAMLFCGPMDIKTGNFLMAIQASINTSEAAAAQAGEGKWKEAAASYQSLAEKYPDHELAPVALEEAARILEKNLNDRPAAEAARKTLLALREKSAAQTGRADPLESYKLASSYAESGESQKAVEAYKKFLASDCKDAKMRVLAQYRLGRLLEKLNQPQEAADAYRAAEAIQTDDNYATQIKEKAKQRTAELSTEK